jgi:hypothetical protein
VEYRKPWQQTRFKILLRPTVRCVPGVRACSACHSYVCFQLYLTFRVDGCLPFKVPLKTPEKHNSKTFLSFPACHLVRAEFIYFLISNDSRSGFYSRVGKAVEGYATFTLPSWRHSRESSSTVPIYVLPNYQYSTRLLYGCSHYSWGHNIGPVS